MAEPLYVLTRAQYDRNNRAVRKVESIHGLNPPSFSPVNWQIVKASSETPVGGPGSGSGGFGNYYPANWYLATETGLEQMAAVWLYPLNGEDIDTDTYYHARQAWNFAGQPVFIPVVTCCPPGTSGSGSGDPPTVDFCGFSLPSTMCLRIENISGGLPCEDTGSNQPIGWRCGELCARRVTLTYTGYTELSGGKEHHWTGSATGEGSCAVYFTLNIYEPPEDVEAGCDLYLTGFLTNFTGAVSDVLGSSSAQGTPPNVTAPYTVDPLPGYTLGSNPSITFETYWDSVAQAGRYIVTACDEDEGECEVCFEDSFADVVNNPLTSHTSNSGGTWTLSSPLTSGELFRITTMERVSASSLATERLAMTTNCLGSGGDNTVYARFEPSPENLTEPPKILTKTGVLFRGSVGGTNGWIALFYLDHGVFPSAEIRLYRRTGGTNTLVKTETITLSGTVNDDREMLVVPVGSAMSVYLDNDLALTHTESTYATNSVYGLYVQKASTYHHFRVGCDTPGQAGTTCADAFDLGVGTVTANNPGAGWYRWHPSAAGTWTITLTGGTTMDVYADLLDHADNCEEAIVPVCTAVVECEVSSDVDYYIYLPDAATSLVIA